MDEIRITLAREQAEALLCMLSEYDAFRDPNIPDRGDPRRFMTAWKMNEIWLEICQNLLSKLKSDVAEGQRQ